MTQEDIDMLDPADPPSPLREAAERVIREGEPDDNFDGEYIDWIVPFEAFEALRAALASSPAPAGPERFDRSWSHFADDCPVSPAPAGLDNAWTEAEAALPSGTWLIEFGRRDSIAPTPNPRTGHPVKFPAHYFASAAREFSAEADLTEYGDTPTAALRALAVRLRAATRPAEDAEDRGTVNGEHRSAHE